MIKTRVLLAAKRDARDARRYYGDRSPRALRDFKADLAAVLRRISEAPQHFPTVDDRYRRALLERFPYWVVFEEVDNVIEIVAVAHTSRTPDYWRS